MREILTRREAGKIIISGLAGLVSGCGCPSYYSGGYNDDSGTSGGSSDDGTGVPGLDTPSQILSNPYIENLVSEVEGQGYNLTLNTGINPPIISGEYSLSGFQLYPTPIQLAPGTFIWRNQTSDNKIETQYSQSLIGQSGTSILGEIIRGQGNKFTVYSILNIRQGGCDEEGILIIDGIQDSQGNVSALYLSSPKEESFCFSPAAGSLDLTLTGAAKLIKESNGYDLMNFFSKK